MTTTTGTYAEYLATTRDDDLFTPGEFARIFESTPELPDYLTDRCIDRGAAW